MALLDDKLRRWDTLAALVGSLILSIYPDVRDECSEKTRFIKIRIPTISTIRRRQSVIPEDMVNRASVLGIFTVVFLGVTITPISSNAQEASVRAIKCPYIPNTSRDPIPTCQGIVATCVGTEGNELIWGSDDDDIIVALGGDDVIHADAGDDLVCAGPGNDAVHGGLGADTIYGEEGVDWLFGAKGNDSLFGGPGDGDVLWGGPDTDFLDGGDGTGDFCLQQRDLARVKEDTCELVYPPSGYTHDEEYEIPPGYVDEAILYKW
ncbi:MAG: calcium-binding protein [Gammaproteobacteria bacterium]